MVYLGEVVYAVDLRRRVFLHCVHRGKTWFV